MLTSRLSYAVHPCIQPTKPLSSAPQASVNHICTKPPFDFFFFLSFYTNTSLHRNPRPCMYALSCAGSDTLVLCFPFPRRENSGRCISCSCCMDVNPAALSAALLASKRSGLLQILPFPLPPLFVFFFFFYFFATCCSISCLHRFSDCVSSVLRPENNAAGAMHEETPCSCSGVSPHS
ncbi:hypothetical protein B0J12DRAFT_300549 [Macrophomina phaseolina]|uniref:Uncharacterized protein n=1 Tax=Macrophomina phaseolina TaxID=35725 RepID=A0ABQ8GP65_9PEZI|nr:hypothetical protein B0J12DRAFT_300549 [Macrophomina phaseolina]